MGQFDMHGGNFAPLGYLKVNAGGSHEENPNGGVQIGVDPQGVPNMVEEGESIYKDFVFSDNIRAEKKFLEEYHLPTKFAGKLYSEIADKFVDEAEDRPNDPISNNGLNAMLLRLADAQEAQKAAKEQAELEEELSNLSPEELEQLETMLAQSEQPEVPQEQMVPEEQMDPAMPVEQTSAQMPIMCNGGFIRRFDDGGPLGEGNIEDNLDDILARIQAANALRNSYNESVRDLKAAQGDLSRTKFGYYLTGKNSRNTSKTVSNLEGKLVQLLSTLSENEGGIYTDPESSYSKAMKTSIQQTSDALKKARARQAKYDANLAKKQSAVDEAQGVVDKSFAALQAMSSGLPYTYTPPTAKGDSSPAPVQATDSIVTAPLVMRRDTFATPTYTPADSAAWIRDYDEIADLNNMSSITEPQNYEVKPNATAPAKLSGGLGHIVEGYNEDSFGGYARGGQMNRYDGGGWADFLQRLSDYRYSLNPANVAGKYAIDRRADAWGGRTARQIEADKAYQDFTNYVLANSNNADVRNYLHALDRGVADGTPLLFNGDELVSGWDDLFRHRREDGNLGIYHLNPEDIGFLTASTAPATAAQTPQVGEFDELSPRMAYAMGLGDEPAKTPSTYTYGPLGQAMGLISPSLALGTDMAAKREATLRAMGMIYPGMETAARTLAYPSKKNDSVSTKNSTPALPTASRYAKAIGAAGLGLYDLAQEPYKYQFPEIRPQAPWGTVNYQPLVYNPMDWAIPYNAISAQTNGALRSLRGTGPSQGANMIALDNNASQNLGNAIDNVWQQNNQHRNEIIAGDNQTEGNRAAFDYGVAKDRATLYDQAARMNFQKELYRQRLNQEEETAKYQALGNQIDAVNEALAGIGAENFRMNQINSNTALQGYQLVPNGMGGYKLVSLGKCGGTLLKKPKK